jgi:hypothetical protein
MTTIGIAGAMMIVSGNDGGRGQGLGNATVGVGSITMLSTAIGGRGMLPLGQHC